MMIDSEIGNVLLVHLQEIPTASDVLPFGVTGNSYIPAVARECGPIASDVMPNSAILMF